MNYKIELPDGTLHLLEISSAYFKSWHVWNVKFKDKKPVMLFKIGNEWMQRTEDFLDEQILNAIGIAIDRIILRRSNMAL